MIVGVGLDLVDIERVQRLVNAKGDRVLRRLFTEAEVRYASVRTHPARHLAARIAAKEAAFKALAGTDEARGIGWRELEVVLLPGGQPALEFHGVARRRAAELHIARIWLTLSHSDSTAAAMVVLETV